MSHELTLRVLEEDHRAAITFCRAFAVLKPGPISPSSARVEKERQFAGKLAEIVAGRLLRVPVDLTVHAGEDAGDLVLYDGRTLGMKAVYVHANMHYDYNLIVRAHECRVDLMGLALVAPARDAVVFCGYVPAAEFHADAELNANWPRQKVRGSDVDEPWTLRRSRIRRPLAILATPAEPEGLVTAADLNWSFR